ncbi:FtsX-like permease family protein [Amycolatopsis sp., V23-08]|uniref:FtsX-like permease family protein n=1 Tax=Amycolatopsis heterodermiae TaxID=3110235 RepID=A0ABU5RMF6_9PSEU|nr:FtsX-like permease family protein [Amycolatopsis sp., V23-08]MEA5366714.1 FtsX-like permease family protein [Amycolatopsis sp., V23-08]
MIRRWFGDLALGMRLALGGGGARTALVRLALTAAGVGMGVAVLLTAASVPHLLGARDGRAAARTAIENGPPVAGIDPVYVVERTDEFRGRGLQGYLVQQTGPAAPALPGVERLPKAGEAVLSPALADLLASPEGEQLRPRFPQWVIGTIGDAGLTGPNELYFYVGSTTAAAQPNAAAVSQFGGEPAGRGLTTLELLLVVLGATTCLVPVFVFVVASTRLAAASRDRRLAALRLVGADRGQVGRIAAGEALLGAFAGLVVGLALFLLVRALVPTITVSAFRGGIFGGDVVPDWRLGVPAVALLPVLACAAAVVALRRVVIEPLGVVRRGTPVRRTLWWRLLPAVVGGVLLAARWETATADAGDTAVITGMALILMAVPLVLPWLVERVAGRLRGGSPAWLLAVRRLQLDGASAARLVSGIAVVLAGSIALQGVYARAESDQTGAADARVLASNFASNLTEVRAFTATLHDLPGARDVPVRTGGRLVDAAGAETTLEFGSCAELRAKGAPGDCRDGDVFAVGTPAPDAHHPAPGDRLWFLGARRADPDVPPQWTIPVDRFRTVPGHPAGLLVTPAALSTATAVGLISTATIPAADLDLVEQVRNAVGQLGWNGIVYSLGTERDGTFALIAHVLSVGSILVLLLAAGSLMIAAWEQLRERRRSLAALMANGVGRGVLARSLLWQMVIPVAVAVVVAVAAGLGLDWLLLTLVVHRTMVVDVSTILVLAATAAIAVLGVTAVTLPALWRSTSLENLREE